MIGISSSPSEINPLLYTDGLLQQYSFNDKLHDLYSRHFIATRPWHRTRATIKADAHCTAARAGVHARGTIRQMTTAPVRKWRILSDALNAP